ncbi:MAG: HEPN domain-containing protein [Candidatus Methanofastidiosia archaeon]|jgi:HEPN domain-containing protein
MIDTSEYERWFNQALHTHSSAKRDYEDNDFGWACFKFQQAAEFALKALLRGVGKLGIGHSLLKLIKDLENLNIDISQIKDCSVTLEKFYIPTRYPDAYPDGSPFEFYNSTDAEKALKCSLEIIEFVKRQYHEICDSTEEEGEENPPKKS